MGWRPRATWAWSGVCALVLAGVCACPLDLYADTGIQDGESSLPVWNPASSARTAEVRPLLREYLIAAFERDYAAHSARNEGRSLGQGLAIYYAQRELQACVDMWRATHGTDPGASRRYLDQAADLVLRAMQEARAHPRSLMWHGQWRGDWPCFYLDSVVVQTGGHNQLCDFQGSAGFLIVARALHELDLPAWRDIAEFVERDIVEKWLFYRPSVTREDLTGPASAQHLLAGLNSGRDAREHFACICLDLHTLGCRDYPYRDWAEVLAALYLTPRYDLDQPAPYAREMPQSIPDDWGLYAATTDDGAVWLSIPAYLSSIPTDALDTSHANRTAWLAARAFEEGLIDQSVIDGLANTLRHRIWAPEKGLYYFNNYVDGTDGAIKDLGPGRGGNIWFGWHRLTVYAPDLEDLFVSVAYDVANGGPNLPVGSQNKTMQEAPLCLEAWAVRLLDAHRTRSFP